MKKSKKAAVIKKVADFQGRVNTVDTPNLLRAVEMQSGELYEGVTDDAEVSNEADYRMITKSDDTVNTQGS